MALADSDALAEPEALEDGVGSAFSASVTARPCEVAVAEGEEDPGEVALSGSSAALSPEELGEALPLEDLLGVGLGVGVPLSVRSRGRK